LRFLRKRALPSTTSGDASMSCLETVRNLSDAFD
jgi:hypothetical protein